MKIQRINEKVIRCVITREEMNRRGIDIEDLMDNRGKAEEFLQYVLSQARYEVDYETTGDVLNVQLSVMKDGEVAMMISDDHNAAIRAIAEQFQLKLDEFRRALEKARKAEMADDKTISQKAKEKIIRDILDSTKINDKVDFDFWARLETMEECIAMAGALSNLQDTTSVLYRYKDVYYLNIGVSLRKDDIAGNVFVMSEYAKNLNTQPSPAPIIKEHGKVILKENALESLRELL